MTTFFLISYFFFFNDTATTEIYTLSLHDALPIYVVVVDTNRVEHVAAEVPVRGGGDLCQVLARIARAGKQQSDRKSTRLNSSHSQISYAVFCLKKKKKA